MTDPQNIDNRAIKGEPAIPVTIMNTSLPGASATPTGGATSAKQDTGNTSLASIDTKTGKITALQGAANMANAQVATSGAAGTLVAARATRRSVTIRNLDATISVYIGVATVTVANGMLLKAGESISLDWMGLIQVIAASGTPTVAYAETYD